MPSDGATAALSILPSTSCHLLTSAGHACDRAGMSAASSSFATGPDRTPPPMISRSQLATIVSGVPAAADVFPSPSAAQQSRGGGAAPQRSPLAVRRPVDPATAKPQVGSDPPARIATLRSTPRCAIARCLCAVCSVQQSVPCKGTIRQCYRTAVWWSVVLKRGCCFWQPALNSATFKTLLSA